MTNTELRMELLAQHAELRELLNIVRNAAQEAVAGRFDATELRSLVKNLAWEVMAHNQFEERELHRVLPDLDAWGPEREGRVVLHHSAEHDAIAAGLDATRREAEVPGLAEQALRATALLIEHLDFEERELLAGDVLRDDIISSGVGG